MKRYLIVSLLATAVAFAEENKKGPDVVVVDLSKVINAERPDESKSLEWAETFGKLRTEIMGHRAKIETKQQEFQQTYANRDMNSLSDDEREALIKLENDVRLATQLYQSSERKLNEFQNGFLKKLTVASEEVRAEQGSKIVLQGPVLAADVSVDITDKVVKKMNGKYETEKRAKKLTKLPDDKAKAKK